MDLSFLAAFALGASVPTLGYAIYLVQSYRDTKGREGDQAAESGERPQGFISDNTVEHDDDHVQGENGDDGVHDVVDLVVAPAASIPADVHRDQEHRHYLGDDPSGIRTHASDSRVAGPFE